MRRGLLSALLIVGSLHPAAARAEGTDVLILEATSARPYDVARKSLEEVLPDELRVTRIALRADGSPEDIERVRELAPRVIVPLGSQATSWALANTEQTPLVFAMVLHPTQSGFARSFEHPGGRLTGAALDIPPREHFRTLREVLGARRVGVLYNPAETGMIITEARAAAREAGVELVVVSVQDPPVLEEALASLGTVDALWSVPDRTVFTRGAAEEVLLYTLRHGIPFMGLSEQYVRAGALLALASSYVENGQQAARQVIRVLSGEPPGRIPIARPESVDVVYNANTARRLGIELRKTSSVHLREVR